MRQDFSQIVKQDEKKKNATEPSKHNEYNKSDKKHDKKKKRVNYRL